jgi:hypothetical protein
MLFNRRNFVQSAACVAVAPAFASLFSPPSVAQSNAVLLPEPIPGQNFVVFQTTASSALFKIHGWDCSERNVNHSQPISAGPISKAFDDGRATIRVMQSWRTAWR